jgi:hypothetical protein
MKDELIHKIQKVLDRRITNQMQVLYLLVELRKLMDREAYQDPVLRMFCNWVVHTSLEKKAEGSTLILHEFDKIITGYFETGMHQVTYKHVSFGAFREALVRCFGTFDLSAPYLKALDDWKKLFKVYALIVGDCPIVFSASRINLKHISNVELVWVSTTLDWLITLKNGSRVRFGFFMG